MSSIFSQIINKKLPANIIYENDTCIAFMDIMPIKEGHVLVVPKLEVDYIFDLPIKEYKELFCFAKIISNAMKKVFKCKRVGLSVIGFEVPHCHIHLVPINKIEDMNFNLKSKSTQSHLAKIAKEISLNINI